MNTLVVYESMFGNTHAVAEAIANGLRPTGDVRVVPVRDAVADLVAWADLLVVGGPTHMHGMPKSKTREGARERAEKPDSGLTLEPDAVGPGVREWLATLADGHGMQAAAFDTRGDGPAFLTGRASSGIASGLRDLGYRLVTESESFLVDKKQHLLASEAARATEWGATLAAVVSAEMPTPAG